MTRHRALAVGALLLAVTLVPVGQEVGAARANPVDRFLDRARGALAEFDFEGSVRITWHDGAAPRREDIEVSARGGTLALADGRVLHSDGRAWLRTDDEWSTLWGDQESRSVPAIASKYRTALRRGPVVLGRRTRMLEVRRDGRVVQRIALDRETGIVLVRVQRDPWARREMRMRFTSLAGIRPTRDTGAVPPVRGAPVEVEAPADVARRVGDGFELVDVRRATDGVRARYSDGVFEASVRAREGVLDWDALPAGGRDVRMGSVRARRYRSAAGSVIVWEADGRTFTCVTEATDRDQVQIVRDVSRERDDTWTSLVRFVSAPFRWS